MQAHTRKHPTETVELRFIGPIVNIARAIETLKPLGFVDCSMARGISRIQRRGFAERLSARIEA
jgi:hypothetical protein